MVVYCAIHNETEKAYVGKTIHGLFSRIRDHWKLRHDKNKHPTYFGNALRTYGLGKFTWVILEECQNEEELNDLEKEYITEFNSIRPGGYNLKTGGGGGSLCGESRQKIRESLIKWNQENVSPNKGRQFTKEHLKNMSLVAKRWHQKNPNPMQGRNHSEATKEKMRRRRHSDETKQKLRLAWKSRAPVSEETRKKQSRSQTGRNHSEETKKKMGIVQKEAWKKRHLEMYYKQGIFLILALQIIKQREGQ